MKQVLNLPTHILDGSLIGQLFLIRVLFIGMLLPPGLSKVSDDKAVSSQRLLKNLSFRDVLSIEGHGSTLILIPLLNSRISGRRCCSSGSGWDDLLMTRHP
jgi:hypothetical protein